MKNSFKLGLVAIVLATSFSACDTAKKPLPNIDSLKADSLKKDSIAKLDKRDTLKAKADTTKKDTSKK